MKKKNQTKKKKELNKKLNYNQPKSLTKTKLK